VIAHHSDDPAFASFLVEDGMDSISLNRDSLLATRLAVAAIETAKPSRHGP
jgi:phosphoenolpyruvate synthase/pyruvate phosphate dikinase